MVVVTIELWPHGNPEQIQTLGVIRIINDGTGTLEAGNYKVEAEHAGIFRGKKKGLFKTGVVRGFMRSLSPYRLLCRSLLAIRET